MILQFLHCCFGWTTVAVPELLIGQRRSWKNSVSRAVGEMNGLHQIESLIVEKTVSYQTAGIPIYMSGFNVVYVLAIFQSVLADVSPI